MTTQPARTHAASPPLTHLLYLHGFRSSPVSAKAQQTLAWLTKHAPSVRWYCPQLPPSPREAMQMVRDEMARWPIDHGAELGIVGSSLGGFYATVLAREAACRAVLINPAVAPSRLLAEHIGEQRSFHADDVFYFRPEFVDELRALETPPPDSSQRILALIAKGDEVLDWRVMSQHYSQCCTQVLEGGDHSLSDYPLHLPTAMTFLGLPTPPAVSGTPTRRVHAGRGT